MTLDVSEILGASQLVGMKVNPRGTAKQGIAVAAAAGWTGDAPRFGRYGYLAVTEDELALIRLKPGIVTPKLGFVDLQVWGFMV